MKAKKTPIKYKIVATTRVTALTFRNWAHALALSGSAGHGAFLDCQCANVARVINIPEPIKSGALYVEIAVTHGAELISPASTEPIPSVTSNAGNAQHKRVPMEVKSESDGRMVWRNPNRSFLFYITNISYVITRVRYQLSNNFTIQSMSLI